jgi:hypothetical protein
VIEVGLGIAIIIVASSVAKCLKAPKHRSRGIGRIEARLDALDRRLVDLQTLMLSIDEQVDQGALLGRVPS